MPARFHICAHPRALSHDVVYQETPEGCCDAEAHPYAGKAGSQTHLQPPGGKEVVQKLIAKPDVLSHYFHLGVRTASSSGVVQALA